MRLLPFRSDRTARGRQIRQTRRRAFTLLELMVSMTILSILMVLVFEMFGQTQRAWTAARARVGTFKEARVAFENLTRSLGQATLNAYTDYDPDNPSNNPYIRQSEMHFTCGVADSMLAGPGSGARPTHCVFYQAPLGFTQQDVNQTSSMGELLNGCGYFIEYGEVDKYLPPFIQDRMDDSPESKDERKRFRLMEFRPPSERMMVYSTDLKDDTNTTSGKVNSWFDDEVDATLDGGLYATRPIADNIIALVIEPRESTGANQTNNTLAPAYSYNSQKAGETQHRLPPIVDVTMVAVEESSILRYQQLGQGAIDDLVPTGLFRTTAAYEADIKRLEGILTAAKVDYRIFKESVVLRAARWDDVSS